MLYYCFNYPHYTLYIYIYTYLYIYIHTYIYIYIPIYTYTYIYIYNFWPWHIRMASPKSILSSLDCQRLYILLYICIIIITIIIIYHYIWLYILSCIILYFILLCDNIFMLYIYIHYIGSPVAEPWGLGSYTRLGPVHHFHYHRDL